MANKCNDINLLNYSGTSQAQRALDALAGTYAKVDERSTADLVLFAKKYGTYLNYYDANNSLTNNWGGLMAGDISVIIASVQVWRTAGYLPYIKNLYDGISSSSTTIDIKQKNFKYIFDLVFSLCQNLNNALMQLPTDSGYTKFLNVAIASKMAIPIQQLSGYYLFFLGNILAGINNASTDPASPFDDVSSVPTDLTDFKKQFNFFNNVPWTVPANFIVPPAAMLVNDSLVDVITNNFFTGAISSFINGVTNIVNQTAGYLDQTLSNYPTHAPQYALFLTFSRLFKHAQNHLNNYTGRHLEFYYKRVLQLNNNLGLADEVHLVFTLQKNIGQYLLKQGTQFKAGKDAGNNDLFYALANDVVVNQASLQALKSICLVKNYNNGSTIIPQQLFASHVANSADGQGAKLTSPDQSWYPFGDLGNPKFKTLASTEIVGFAIASNVLYLNEGTRTVSIFLNCNQVDISAFPLLNNAFSIKFTGNKKWFAAADYLPDTGTSTVTITNIILNGETQTQLVFTVTLNGSVPPIIPYSQKIHGGNFIQQLPMVQILVTDFTSYAAIKSLVVTSLTIQTDVKAVKNLVLQNDNGKIDTSKPFKPFGDFPDQGAAFIMGCKEIFQKKLSDLKINFNWQSVTISDTNIAASALKEAQWQKAFDTGVDLNATPIVLTGVKTNIPQSAPDFTANENYTVASIDGFIKLSLDSDKYNLTNYLNKVNSNLADTKVTVTPDSTTPTKLTYQVTPPPVATPPSIIAQSINIDYTANETIAFDETTQEDFDKRTGFFYHIEPFGFREMHSNLTKDTITFLPVFNLDDGSQTNGGELWIGLNNTIPGETQSILFQVSEGSSNPLKAVTTVSWFYMSMNNWILLKPTEVIDQTNNLSQSGLVILNLPGNETTNNTRADNNLLWIKAVVGSDADAVCKLIAVLPNAAKAQFVINDADKIYFTQNIAAGTISKPAIADAALKQTSQPYPSFGGKAKELDQQFNQRVSERLRHKNRAASSWDYERLILQHFPKVHKAKCLNHTTLKEKTQAYSELKPGDVMVVVVPDLSLVTGANPLLPFTSVGLLTDIKNYLKPLCSPFVHLHVCNPQFEAVQFNFDVWFVDNNTNSSYYQQQLNIDIQQFLMPWAFGSTAVDIEFGGKIEKSVVLNFVQSRPYVDFVTCFKMVKFIYQEDGTFSSPSDDMDEAIASTARSILVPYSYNNINPTANCACNG